MCGERYAKLASAFKAVWSFREGGIRVIIPSFGGEGAYKNSMSSSGLCATYMIIPTLQAIYDVDQGDEVVHVDRSHMLVTDESYKRCNLVLIGGPARNHVTRKVLETLDLASRFEEYSLYNGTQIYEPVTDEEEHIKVDYGLVVKTVSPFSENRLIYIMAGCRAYGTVGAASLLISAKGAKMIAGYSGNEGFEGLVRVNIKRNGIVPSSLEVIKWRTL